MRADGIADSHEDGLAYLDDVVGDIGAASSPARREMFLTAGYEMINFLIAQGRSAGPVPGLERLLPEPQGRQRGRSCGRGHPVRRRRSWASWSDKVQPSLAKNYGFVVQDQRAALGAVLQPFAARVRRGDAGVPAHRAARIAPSRDAHQRCLAHRSDAQGADRPRRRRAADLDERRDGRSHRRGRPCRRRARLPRRHLAEHRGAQGSPAGRGRLQPQRGHAPPVQRRPAQRGAVVDRQRRRHRRGAADGDARWARRPTCWTRPGGCHRFSSPTAAPPPRHSARAGSGPVPSTSTATGQRFCNESNSYVEVGKAMYANKAVPCWMIFDEGYVAQIRRRARTRSSETHACRRRTDRAAARSSAATPSPTSRARSTFPPTSWRRPSSGSTSSPPRASTRTSGAASRRTTTASAIPGIEPNAAARPARHARRTTRPGCSRPTSGRAGE